jgi:hypothetical protein
MNSANQIGKSMRQFPNVTNKTSRATDLSRSTRLNDDLPPSHHKPVTMQEFNLCSGSHVGLLKTIAASRATSLDLAAVLFAFCISTLNFPIVSTYSLALNIISDCWICFLYLAYRSVLD